MSFFHLHLLPCSLYPIGLDCQAALNGLELIFHVDAPCQYEAIDAEAQKELIASYAFSLLCVLRTHLGFFFSGGMQNLYFYLRPL